MLSFWQLGRLPLLDVDEPVYGEVGKEMARAGLAGWLTPHYNGSLWFDKPPLFYWLTALAMRVFGVSEFAARFPSALLGIGLVAVTYAFAHRMFPQKPQIGFWSGYALATTAPFFFLTHAAVTDMTLAFTLTTGLLAVYAWIQTGRGRWMLLAGVMTGLAALDKGPVALVLIGVQVLVFLMVSRQAKRLLSPALWGGFFVCVVVALPWYLLMIHLHGSLFIQGFLEANNFTRYLKAEHTETQQFYYYVPVFCALFLPWTVAMPGVLAAAAKNVRNEHKTLGGAQPTLFLVLWCALVFVFFSAAQTKLWTYIFPMLPAAAVLVGRYLAEPVQAGAHNRTFWAFSVFLTVLAAALLFVGHKFGVVPLTLALWAVALGGGALLAALRPSNKRWTIPGAALSLTLLFAWSSPTWKTEASEVSDRDAARVMAAAALKGESLYAIGMKHPSLVYYSDRRVIYGDDRAIAIQDMTAHPEHIYAVGSKVLEDLRSSYGLHSYRVLYQNKHLLVVQAAPQRGPGTANR